jgi:hypothetical protein
VIQTELFENKKIKFPTNPFPDVKPSDFNKLNKKRVTEDFVSENFELMGWRVFEPFTDTGIDRIITKKVCPSGHTPLDVFENSLCRNCGTPTIDITRFLQIKTRSLKNGIFGFTIRPKDIRIDPRHVYVFYCDTTQDFFIVPIFEYLKFFKDVNSNPFSATAFRRENQKLNSLTYDQSKDSWWWGEHSWEKFRNINGLAILQNPDIDLNLDEWIKKTRKLSNELLLTFNAGRSYPQEIESLINDALKTRVKIFEDKSSAMEQKEKVLNYLRTTIKDNTIFESIMKYWETIKNLEIRGETEEEEEE